MKVQKRLDVMAGRPDPVVDAPTTVLKFLDGAAVNDPPIKERTGCRLELEGSLAAIIARELEPRSPRHSECAPDLGLFTSVDHHRTMRSRAAHIAPVRIAVVARDARVDHDLFASKIELEPQHAAVRMTGL